MKKYKKIERNEWASRWRIACEIGCEKNEGAYVANDGMALIPYHDETGLKMAHVSASECAEIIGENPRFAWFSPIDDTLNVKQRRRRNGI